MSDELAIMQVVSSMGLLTDAREWSSVVGLFTEQVEVDYTSLNGGEPVTLGAEELVAGWSENLTRLKTTQHLIGNHIVEVDHEANTASCACNVTATHVRDHAIGDSVWVVGGRYDVRLRRLKAGWRICALTLTVAWVTGNQAIMLPT